LYALGAGCCAQYLLTSDNFVVAEFVRITLSYCASLAEAFPPATCPANGRAIFSCLSLDFGVVIVNQRWVPLGRGRKQETQPRWQAEAVLSSDRGECVQIITVVSPHRRLPQPRCRLQCSPARHGTRSKTRRGGGSFRRLIRCALYPVLSAK